MHAERLHEDAVWRALGRLLAVVERRSGAATFLVSPLRASVARVDLGPRLRELADRGHEIGQHTHYYALAEVTAGPVRFEKRTDVSPANVRRCLDHDHARLTAAGIRPRTFVAGAWESPPAAHAWLVEHHFRFDLTRRTFALRYPGRPPSPGTPGDPSILPGGLLDIPTNGTVLHALQRHALGTSPARPYAVWYVHDYDLHHLRHRAALRALDHLLADAPRITIPHLARLLNPPADSTIASPTPI